MFRLRTSLAFPLLFASPLALAPVPSAAKSAPWTFAVSGDSRNCGDFVMPAIASKVKAEKDAFYWHLGDFRWMSQPDEDLKSMQPGGRQLSKADYQPRAWDDFLTYQMASFGSFPVFLGRGNHETVAPMTREGYVAKFSGFLNRPEILAQRQADQNPGANAQPWYHWTRNGVDFITLDNSSKNEFTDAQLQWLRAVLDRDLAPGSKVKTIVAGMHEALPHSTGSNHAMDDWDLGLHLVFRSAEGGKARLPDRQPLPLLRAEYLQYTLLEAERGRRRPRMDHRCCRRSPLQASTWV